MTALLHFEDFPVGATDEFGPYRLSDTLVRDYARAFDPRPALLTDPPAAPPWMLPAVLMRMNYDGWVCRAAGQGAPGVDAMEWPRPVHAGDVLTGRYVVLAARTSRSKPALGLVQYRYELLDAARQLVFSQTNFVMVGRRYPAPAAEETPAAPNTRVRSEPASEPIALGACEFPAARILAFAREYDPQPFHVDEAAAKAGPFGALAASGWHTAAAWMGAYVRTVQGGETRLPMPGRFVSVETLRWLRPVYAGDRIAFTAALLSRDQDGAMLRGTGTNEAGVTVYDFTTRITVAG